MACLALNEKQLSRFTHHWLWGLSINKKQGPGLFDAIKKLEQNAMLRSQIEAEVQSINQKGWFICSLYWLLNYRQYRFHYYQLQGYWSWKLYQKGVTMFSAADYSTAMMTGGFIIATSFIGAMKILPPQARPSLNWFYSKVRPYLANLTLITLTQTPHPTENASQIVPLSSLQTSEQATPADSAQSSYFIVRKTMVTALKTLGIIAKIDEQVSLTTLKSAYKAACLQTHPDKSGTANHAAFIAVTDAYKALLDLIQEQVLEESNVPVYSSPWDVLTKMEQDIKEMREENSVMLKEIAIMREENSVMLKEIAIMGKEIVQIRTELRQSKLEVKKIAKEIKRLNVLERKQAAQERELDKIEKAQEERAKAQHELYKKQKKEIRDHIIRLNKGHNFPELTEETLQAYCNDPQSFIKKVKASIAANSQAFFSVTPEQMQTARSTLASAFMH